MEDAYLKMKRSEFKILDGKMSGDTKSVKNS